MAPDVIYVKMKLFQFYHKDSVVVLIKIENQHYFTWHNFTALSIEVKEYIFLTVVRWLWSVPDFSKTNPRETPIQNSLRSLADACDFQMEDLLQALERQQHFWTTWLLCTI